MSSPLTRLVSSLMGSREGVLPSIQTFPPLDIDQIATELRLAERAEELGKHDLPPSDSEVQDSAEAAVLAEIERRARKAEEDYRSQLGLYDSRLGRASASTDQRARIEAAGESALTDFKVKAIDDLNHLHDVRRDVEHRDREFEAFRAHHKLDRLPLEVSSNKARWLTLAIVVMVESIVNGSFFAEGSETGWIGGGVQALVLSVLNVGAAALCAMYGRPLIFHKNILLRFLGVVASLGFVAWSLVLNFMVGVFRDLFIRQAGVVSVANVAQQLVSSPFGLEDTRSVVLVALGLLLSVVAFIDAAGMTDPYPGFGAVGTRRAKAVVAYAKEKSSRLAGLARLRDEALNDMSQVIDLMRNSDHETKLALAGRSRLHENYRAYLRHLVQAHAALCQRYRDANARSRQTPPPSRFGRPVTTPEFLNAPPLSEAPDVGQDARTHVIERMEFFIRAVNHQFEAEVQRYKTLSDLAQHDASA